MKHDIKASKTLSATGSGAGDGQRNHIQVLANSIVASVLILWHTWILKNSGEDGFSLGRVTPMADVVAVGIVACVLPSHLWLDLHANGVYDDSNYAAVAADTYSSELGILSESPPRLVTSLSLRVVPPGTNGGVTAKGLQAGALGAFTIAVTSAVLLPFRISGSDGGLYVKERLMWVLAVTGWGALGSLLDSVLGGLLQASVVDKRTGKVVEGTGGRKVAFPILIYLCCTKLIRPIGPHSPLLLPTRRHQRSILRPTGLVREPPSAADRNSCQHRNAEG